MSEFRPVCSVDDIAPGAWDCFRVGTDCVVVFNLDGEFHAIDDNCPHRGGPLSKGFLEGTVMYCPLHGWPFDVRSGLMPGNEEIGVPTYPILIEDGKVLIGAAIPVPEEPGQVERA